MPKLKELEILFSQGKITRREFMARVAALGLTAAVSPALLPASAHGSTPKKGGRLRIGSTGAATSDSLDPATINNMYPLFINYQLRNNLVEVDHNTEPKPELAESWEAAPGAAKWIFKLRRDVEFHNGKTLDAEDVIFSINHHRGEDSKSPAKPILAIVKDIKTDGKHAVIFTLDAGNADFPFILNDYHLTIVPSGTTDFEKGIGTGGYTLISHEPGVRALVKRNPNYWNEGRAHFDVVETIGIADVNSRTNALRAGQVDVINRCEPKTFHLLKKSPGIQGIVNTGFKHYEWAMLCDMEPFKNNDVRLAMKYAIDREQMLKQIIRGYGVLGNDHPIAPANRYTYDKLPQRKYDPDKARYHIKKAGIEGQTIDLHAAEAGFPGAVDAAVLYAEQAAKAGIKINVVREPNDGYYSNVWIKKPFCAIFWGGRPTEDWMFSTTYAEGVAWNDTHWKHAHFNKLLVAARAELDDNKRREMYHEMQKIVHDDGGAIIFAFVSNLDAATDKVKFGPQAVNWELDGGKFAERWWFES